jgi:hypothetical protein
MQNGLAFANAVQSAGRWGDVLRQCRRVIRKSAGIEETLGDPPRRWPQGMRGTLPHWRECLRPVATRLAQTFRESLAGGNVFAGGRSAKGRNARSVIPASKQSPLEATPRKASQPRPYATRKWRTPTVETRPSTPIACAMRGEPVLRRRRRHCEACIPKARREHGRRGQRSAPKPGREPRARRGDRRRASQQPRWAREHPGQRDEAWFKREIAPKLDAFSLKEIADATGLSLTTCSRIRAGAKVPHPRHWDALFALIMG